MRKLLITVAIIIGIVVAGVILEGPVAAPAGKEEACIASGGTVTTASCCLSVDEFPNLCTIGACGCAPEYSHTVKICDCGEGKCFDGTTCVPRGSY